MSSSNQIKQEECQPQTNFIVLFMKTHVWNVRRVFSIQPEWTFSCTCLIFNTPEIQNMCGKILKLWIRDVNNEVCLIPKFQNFSPSIFRFLRSAKYAASHFDIVASQRPEFILITAWFHSHCLHREKVTHFPSTRRDSRFPSTLIFVHCPDFYNEWVWGLDCTMYKS